MSGFLPNPSGGGSGESTPPADGSTQGKIKLSNDLGGTANSPSVIKINGSSVPATASTVGNTLIVSAANTLTYSAINLAGGANYVSGVLPQANLPASTVSTKGILQLAGDLGGTSSLPTVKNMTLPNQTAGSVLYYTGTQWTSLTSSIPGSKLAMDTSSNPIWSSPDGLIVKKVATISLSAGNQDTTAYTVPVNSSLIVSSIFIKLTTAVVGTGSVAVISGTTLGGSELTVSKSVNSSSAIGVISGLNIDSLGSTLLPGNGFITELPATTNIYVRCTTTGSITSGSISVYIYGSLLQ